MKRQSYSIRISSHKKTTQIESLYTYIYVHIDIEEKEEVHSSKCRRCTCKNTRVRQRGESMLELICVQEGIERSKQKIAVLVAATATATWRNLADIRHLCKESDGGRMVEAAGKENIVLGGGRRGEQRAVFIYMER